MTSASPADLAAQRGAVALAYGISDTDLDLLGDGTTEEMAARAERLTTLTQQAAAAPARPETPPRDPHPGATPRSFAGSEEELLYGSLFGHHITR